MSLVNIFSSQRSWRRVRSINNVTNEKKLKAFSEGSIIPASNEKPLTKLLSIPLPNNVRYTGYTHVSDLIYSCDRTLAIAYKMSLFQKPVLFSSLEVTFSIGHGINELITKKLSCSPDFYFGKWTCNCGTVSQTTVKSKATKFCTLCNSYTDRYHEIVLHNEEYKISGSVDGMLLINNHLYIIEIKSIARDAWQSLSAPQPNHVIQVVMYWWMTKQLNMPLIDQVSICYVPKEHVQGFPYKEFTLIPSKLVNKLEDYLLSAAAIKSYVHDNGTIPLRTCPNPGCTAAKQCHVTSACFSLEKG